MVSCGGYEMRVAIHQPHYFPWIGYFDKMAKCDKFVILDEVQMEKNSQMQRNRVLCDGNIKYITISADIKGFLDKRYSEILIKNKEVWSQNQLNALKNYYRKSKYFDEVYVVIETFLKNNYLTLCEWTVNSIILIKNLLEIETQLVFQSTIDYDKGSKQSDLVLDICRKLNANIYISGRGASVRYLNQEMFDKYGISIEFQEFIHPVYPQINVPDFVPGLSIIDCLFNLGINLTKEIFWDSVKHKNHG